MLSYVLRKALLSVPLLWGVMTLIWLLLELSPGDVSDAFISPDMPVEIVQMVRDKWALDEPAWRRYLVQMANMARLEFGLSMTQERPVSDIILETLPNTVVLSLLSVLVAQTVGIAIGIVQATRQHTASDAMLALGSLFFYSMPGFWLALMLQLVFTLYWPVLPSSGMTDPVMYEFMGPFEQLADRARHLVLPVTALGLAAAAGDARYMRSSMLEVIRQDYIRTARAKGLPETRVVLKHALRNALLPIVTLLGLNLPFLFSGAVLVETVFGWPGMGRLIVNAIFTQDVPVIMGCFFVFTLLVVAGSLVADVLYAVVDPRIRYR